MVRRETGMNSAGQRARQVTKGVFVVAWLVFWFVGMGIGLSWWRAASLTLFGVAVNGLLLLGGATWDPREGQPREVSGEPT